MLPLRIRLSYRPVNVGLPTASIPVLVEIAIGRFSDPEAPSPSSPCLIAVRTTVAPYAPIEVTEADNTTIPTWFTDLPTAG